MPLYPAQVAAADGLGFFVTEAAGAGLSAVVGHGFVIRQVLLTSSPHLPRPRRRAVKQG